MGCRDGGLTPFSLFVVLGVYDRSKIVFGVGRRRGRLMQLKEDHRSSFC